MTMPQSVGLIYTVTIYIYNLINPSCTVAQVMPFLGKMRFQHVYILCVYYEMLGVNHFSLSNCRSCCSFSAILWACSSANGPRPGTIVSCEIKVWIRYGYAWIHEKKQQLNCSLASCRADVPRTKDSLMWLILCWFPFVSAVPREYFWILRYLWVCPTGINTHNSYLSLQHRNWLGLSKQHLRQNPLPPPHAIWVQSPKRTQTSQSCTSLGTLW